MKHTFYINYGGDTCEIIKFEKTHSIQWEEYGVIVNINPGVFRFFSYHAIVEIKTEPLGD